MTVLHALIHLPQMIRFPGRSYLFRFLVSFFSGNLIQSIALNSLFSKFSLLRWPRKNFSDTLKCEYHHCLYIPSSWSSILQCAQQKLDFIKYHQTNVSSCYFEYLVLSKAIFCYHPLITNVYIILLNITIDNLYAVAMALIDYTYNSLIDNHNCSSMKAEGNACRLFNTPLIFLNILKVIQELNATMRIMHYAISDDMIKNLFHIIISFITNKIIPENHTWLYSSW